MEWAARRPLGWSRRKMTSSATFTRCQQPATAGGRSAVPYERTSARRPFLAVDLEVADHGLLGLRRPIDAMVSANAGNAV